MEFRIGIHLGDVVEEADGDLMGDGVNIAARLEGIARPGHISLSEDAYRQVKSRLKLAVIDLGPTQLKNITDSIRVYALQVGVPSEVAVTTQVGSPPHAKPITFVGRTQLQLALIGCLTLIAIAAGAWRFEVLRSADQPQADRPERSIVVLPLENVSGDATQNYMVDALTDELTTSISRIPGTFVIVRDTAFTYKGKPTDIKQVGRDLGVRYAMEGSVQPTQNRIRVNTQLIDTETGAHLWAETFDENRTDLLQMEDDIVTRLARTLDLKITDIEASRAGRLRPDNPEAEDLALRCLASFNDNYVQAHDPLKHPEIYTLCERAFQIDPGNSRALNLLTYRLLRLTVFGADVSSDLERLDALVDKALVSSPNDGDLRAAQARLAFLHGNYSEAIVDDERVIAMEPSRIDAYIGLSDRYFLMGQEEKAIETVDKAIRLSPRDPGLPYLLLFKAQALSVLGRDADASMLLDEALTLAPKDRQILITQAATLGNLGKLREAIDVYRRYVAITGAQMATISEYGRYLASVTPADIPSMVAWREHKLAGLRKAGMPEG